MALCSRKGRVFVLEVIVEILITGALCDLCSELILFTIILIVFFFTSQCKVPRIHGSLIFTVEAHLRTARRILSRLLFTSNFVEHLGKHLIDLGCLALNLLLSMSVLLQLVDYK